MIICIEVGWTSRKRSRQSCARGTSECKGTKRERRGPVVPFRLRKYQKDCRVDDRMKESIVCILPDHLVSRQVISRQSLSVVTGVCCVCRSREKDRENGRGRKQGGKGEAGTGAQGHRGTGEQDKS